MGMKLRVSRSLLENHSHEPLRQSWCVLSRHVITDTKVLRFLDQLIEFLVADDILSGACKGQLQLIQGESGTRQSHWYLRLTGPMSLARGLLGNRGFCSCWVRSGAFSHSSIGSSRAQGLPNQYHDNSVPIL